MHERVSKAWRWLRDSDAFVVVCIAWAALGFWGSAHPDFGPPVLWILWTLPLIVFVAVGLTRYLPEQDFTAQPWIERAREVRRIFRWRSTAGRQWGLWVLALAGGIPFGLLGVVVGPPEFDRLGSLTVLIACAATGWIGLKAVDARVTRHERARAAGYAPDPGVWVWDSRGEIIAVIVIVALLAVGGLVMEWADDDGPNLPVAALWYAGLGSLVIVPVALALRRWDRDPPRSS